VSPEQATGPMAGVRVVELGVWIAGPAAGGILSDWGADVVKIEPPLGDPARTFQRMLGGDLPTNPVFELDNRSKRSIVVDLGTDEGRALALELVDAADVFLTNIRVSALRRAGLDPETLRARNPRLVYAIITGYGLEGDEADRPAYDIAAYWARSGLAASLTPPGGQLPFQRGGMGDHTVGMTAAAMISAALFARERTGEGDLVSTSLFRQGAYTIGFDVNVALMWGQQIRVGTRTQMGNVAINNYSAGDGRRFWSGSPPRRPGPPMRASSLRCSTSRSPRRPSTSGPPSSTPTPTSSGPRFKRWTSSWATSSSMRRAGWSTCRPRTVRGPCWPPRRTSTSTAARPGSVPHSWGSTPAKCSPSSENPKRRSAHWPRLRPRRGAATGRPEDVRPLPPC